MLHPKLVGAALAVVLALLVLVGCEEMVESGGPGGGSPEPVTPTDPTPPAEPDPPKEPDPPPEPEQPPPPEPAFRIDVVYEMSVPAVLKEELTRAVEYWQMAITADAGPPMVVPPPPAAECGTAAVGRTVDDLLVSVTMTKFAPVITDLGGVIIDNTPLAIAYNCGERSTGLPFYGTIAFTDKESQYKDTAFNRDDVYNIARHEIAHLLGFGSSSAWNSYLMTTDGIVYFHGPKAMARYGGPVPTRDGGDHWTPVDGLIWDIMSVPSVYVRAVTLAALDDIGHQVDYGAAETVPFD